MRAASQINPQSHSLPSQRLVSLDAYRGLVMLLMMAGETLNLPAVARALPGAQVWAFLAHHQSHVEWLGCSLHDLIQPSFSFIVGVALPFSIAARMGRGQKMGMLTLHAAWRSLLLISLGIFLRSVGQKQTYFTFTDTLTQIGLGYTFLFLLGFCSNRVQWIIFALLLSGDWLAFALYQAPSALDYAHLGSRVPADWPARYGMSGFQSHWNLMGNAAWRFDVWFLNLFPREKPFVGNPGGTCTLNFITTLATMILGLITGGMLRGSRRTLSKLAWLVFAGLLALAAGWGIGQLGVCPVVKKLWTPSWVLFSGGWCLLLMALFYLVLDICRLRAWSFPLVIVGLNSIAAYCLVHLIDPFIRSSLVTHLGKGVFRVFGNAYEPLLLGGGSLLILWLILLWMYCRKIFLRI